jgi:putative DNA primase/helicase
MRDDLDGGASADDQSADAAGDEAPAAFVSAPKVVQKEGYRGSSEDDDPERPMWDHRTVFEKAFDYVHEDGKYAYTKLKGRRADRKKAFLTGHRFQGSMGDLQLERQDGHREFYGFDGITNYKKGANGQPDLLYRLHELACDMAAQPDAPIYVVEGEKDADTLRERDLIVTTNPNGALSWKPAFTPRFAGRDVVVLIDNDEKGRARGDLLARALHGVTRSVKVVDLPGLDTNGDVTDWLNGGKTKDDLLKVVADTPAVTAPTGHAVAGGDDEPLSHIVAANHWADRHGVARRYDHTRGRWMRVDPRSGVWQEDECRATFNEMGTLIHNLGAGAARYSNAGFISGTETIARGLPTVAVTHKHFDIDPMILGTPAGPVDLRTGKLLPSDPSLLISRCTSVGPTEGRPEKFLAFLLQSNGGNAAMVDFLQVVLGYMLTGLTVEQALFFIHGDGGNGKGVFINIIRRIFGNYAVTAAMETFTASKHDAHPTGLAMLNGPRLVTASETERGKPWAESRIKQLTGGDEISARFMRGDFFSFAPKFKLLIIGNFAPELSTVDDAMKRRINIIPFIWKPEQTNINLEQEIEDEFPQILNWMIHGCLLWQSGGLARPDAVIDATRDYFEDQDVFGQWLDEFCETGPTFATPSQELFHNWSLFADDMHEPAGNMKGFGAAMSKRGFRNSRASSGDRLRSWKGLRLQTIEDDAGRMIVKSPRRSGVF